MAKEQDRSSTERQVGEIVGTLNSLIASVNALSRRFEEHLKEHRQTWLWIVPTILSLATLIMLIVHEYG